MFLIGIILLVLVVWATTMIGISINKKQQNPPSVVISFCNKNPNNDITLKFQL